MSDLNPIFLKDFYKVGHVYQYPENTTLVFNNFTPRKSRLDGINYSVFFGLQYFIKKYLMIAMQAYLNGCEPDYIHQAYQQLMKGALNCDRPYNHIKQLWELGYLPIAIYALPEKTLVPCGVPALVMYNTHPDFYWLPNMLETVLSCTLWQPCTTATIAHEYRKLLDKYAEETSDVPDFVSYQCHDFSMRGMSSVESASTSGMAHLQYFKGTDSIPGLLFNQLYYEQPLEFASVPATEHSVMSAGGKDHEFDTFKRLITDIYPSGIVSIVSDTWDLWKVVGDFLPRLKDTILSRDGTVVIRPDSGDPVDILCGTLQPGMAVCSINPYKGLIECLWDIFGGTVNSKGFKQLDPHIGAIYGDSITLDRARDILQRLAAKGFASTNIVFGIGSFSYQYHTRDSLGWAMKATYAEINGEGRAIYKDPVTDDGTKKSHRGLLKVVKVEGAHGSTLQVLQEQTWEQFHADDNELKLVFKDGKLTNETE